MWLFYDFGVVDILPLDVGIRGKIMRFYKAQLLNSSSKEYLIKLKPKSAQSERNKHLLRFLANKQLRF